MTIETFTFFGHARPTTGTGREVTPRVLTASFGDGYSQRVGDGINTLDTKASVIFEAMTRTEAQATEAFFARHSGFKSFLWTFPGDTEQKRWIARSWRTSTVSFDVMSITVEFERVFGD